MATENEPAAGDTGKLYWEVEKLKAEVLNLRRPLMTNPSAWVALASALAAVFGIGLQYLSSQAKVEQAELKLQSAQTQIAEAEKALQTKTLAIKQRNEALADLEKRQIEVEQLIARKQKELEALSMAATKGGGGETARAVQEVIYSAQQTLGATRKGIEADRIALLVTQMNDPSTDIRKSATGRLEQDYSANPVAIGMVLDTLSEQNLGSLSASGRINSLYFLNQTDARAWTEEHRSLAARAIERMRKRSADGTAKLGAQTAESLGKLERRLPASK